MARTPWWQGWLDKQSAILPKAILIAAVYAICYLLARSLSKDQWYLPAGVRVGALLLLHRRYWPYLFAGEFAALIYLRQALLEKYGLPWVIVSSTTVMPLAILILYFHRRFISPNQKFWFVSLAIFASILVTTANIATVALFQYPVKNSTSLETAFRFMVGDYQAILMIAPLALLWHERNERIPFAARFLLDSAIAIGVVAAISLCIVATPESAEHQKNYLRVLMILPAVVLTIVHGWRGAAVGIAVVNLATGLTMQRGAAVDSHDPYTFMVQEITTITATALWLFGASISRHYHRAQRTWLDRARAIRMMRTNMQESERVLRARAIQIRTISEQADEIIDRTVQRLRERGHYEAALEVRNSKLEQAHRFKEQLELVFPFDLEDSGLYWSLYSAPIAFLEQHGMGVSCHLTGDPNRLSYGLQLAAYRSICEILGTLLAANQTHLHLSVHCGRYRSTAGAAIRVTVGDAGDVSCSDLEFESIRLRTVAYRGKLRCRDNRILIVLGDAENSAEKAIYGELPPMTQLTPAGLV